MCRFKTTLPQILKTLREQKHLTQQELGDILGVTAQTVSKWELGYCCPDIMLLPEIAKLANCRIDDFFVEE